MQSMKLRLPHDTTAERVVLGAMVRDAKRFTPMVLGRGLSRGDFYHHSHQLVFTAAVELFHGRGCDLVSLYRTLRRRGELCELCPISPALWLSDLCDENPLVLGDTVYEEWKGGRSLDESGVLVAAELVLWNSSRRDEIALARTVIRDAMDGVYGPPEQAPRLKVFRELVAV